MALVTGNEKLQGMYPVATTNDTVLDPKIRISRSGSGETHRPKLRLKRRRSPSPDIRHRKYRPSSPVDSVRSDLDILANKDRLKDKPINCEREPEPIEQLGDDMYPSLDHEHSDLDLGPQEEDEFVDEEFDDNVGGEEEGFERDHNQMPQFTYNETMEKKAAILAHLDRARESGEKLTYDDDMTLEQLTLIKSKVTHKAKSQHLIKLMRHGITMYVQLLEYISRSYPSLNLDLHDFSKEMFQRKTEYDDLLWEIHELYSDNMKMNPVFLLILTVTGQAIMYSAARQFIKNLQFGLGIASPPPSPPTASTSTTPLNQDQSAGIVDVEISGPTSGFDTSELLELCRKEAQTKADEKTSIPNDPNNTNSEIIQVNIPTPSSGGNNGVQIIRNSGQAPTQRAPRKSRKSVAVEITPNQIQVEEESKMAIRLPSPIVSRQVPASLSSSTDWEEAF